MKMEMTVKQFFDNFKPIYDIAKSLDKKKLIGRKIKEAACQFYGGRRVGIFKPRPMTEEEMVKRFKIYHAKGECLTIEIRYHHISNSINEFVKVFDRLIKATDATLEDGEYTTKNFNNKKIYLDNGDLKNARTIMAYEHELQDKPS